MNRAWGYKYRVGTSRGRSRLDKSEQHSGLFQENDIKYHRGVENVVLCKVGPDQCGDSIIWRL